ncbi:type VI secretion system-associated FHA domain protein TagH [Rhizobium sp. CSW-27]|uniref:type VI secretion system-associated FHA domain protein TagH n=1 Tax=Rhizobium sp. CSW-27 TaxID=2839985 RepID=UPI001C010931|nr:type VI secretion system-associated FHA domain protein TagH [Rhizobium sp. CSW-27]MBT9373064.1 type VI secretion system-associated FHA domain protein TagH [Rhizobium sp. CSW-27]
MDSITLRITNVDRLPDGGPLSYSSTGQRFEIGREAPRDWVLPDPQLFISGRHCEIVPEGDAYVLYDVSRNGTFLNGAQQRMKSPHRLAHGDTLVIGAYVVSVSIASPVELVSQAWGYPATAGSAPVPPVPEDEDIWGAPSAIASPPMDKRLFAADAAQIADGPDFVGSHLAIPVAQPMVSPQARAVLPPGAGLPEFPSLSGAGAGPYAGGVAVPGAGENMPHAFGAVPLAQAPAERPPRGGQDESLLAAFREGARLPAHALGNRSPNEIMREIGMLLAMITDQVAQLLRARASAKAMVRTSSRTMIGARDNNPMKFLPDPVEALEAMLSRGRPGYLDGPRAFQEAFADLKGHEMATYAAMQRALARLLEDLSPEAIESKITQSTFANRKAKAWEIFVARWEAKTEAHANGMLDVFLLYFSEAYQEMSAKVPPR